MLKNYVNHCIQEFKEAINSIRLSVYTWALSWVLAVCNIIHCFCDQWIWSLRPYHFKDFRPYFNRIHAVYHFREESLGIMVNAPQLLWRSTSCGTFSRSGICCKTLDKEGLILVKKVDQNIKEEKKSIVIWASKDFFQCFRYATFRRKSWWVLAET